MTYASVLRAAGALAFGLLAALRVSAAADPLPALAADQSRVSVSGLSSGGYMAGQFQIAYSKLVTGAGIVAGGPYGCAQTPGASVIPFWPVVLGLNLDRAQKRCMKDGGWFSDVPPAGLLADQVTALADKERIDPVADVKTDRIYVFSGAKDTTVQREVVERTVELYEALGVPRGRITFIKHETAAHAFITDDKGLACGVAGEPFIEDCDYDQAKAILETIYGPMRPANSGAGGQFLTFDQGPYLSDGRAGMAEEGVAYVPKAAAARPAVRCMWCSMAASRVARRSATSSSRRAAMPAGPKATASCCCFRRSRPAHPIRTAAGTGGAIRGADTWRKAPRRWRPCTR